MVRLTPSRRSFGLRHRAPPVSHASGYLVVVRSKKLSAFVASALVARLRPRPPSCLMRLRELILVFGSQGCAEGLVLGPGLRPLGERSPAVSRRLM